MGGEGGEEGRLHRRVVAEGERLLALVDHQDRGWTPRRKSDQRVQRSRARGDHHDLTAVALQRGGHAGPDQ